MSDPSNDEGSTVNTLESTGALLIGGLLGGMTFLLCSLLLGPRVALAIAGVSLIVALARRVGAAAVAFAVVAALIVLSLRSAATTLSTALLSAAAAFAIGLAVFARVRLRQKLAHADATMRGAPMLDV